MKVLVTGGAGYLGSVLVPHLLLKGHTVTVLDILMFGGESLLPHYGNPNFNFIHGDIRDQGVIDSIFINPYDCVIHLAALVGEPACKINPLLTEQINHRATVQLAQKAKERKIKKFLFSSTCSNYGVSDSVSLADEESTLNPLSEYASTKIAAERDLLELSDKFFAVCVLRLATLFGLSSKMRFNLLINEMVKNAYADEEILIYKEEAWRPYTHLEDAARVFSLLLEKESNNIQGKIYNVGTENLQKKQLVSLIKKLVPSARIKNQGGVVDKRDYRVSFEKIKKELEFVPTKSVEEGMVEMLDALKNNFFPDLNNEKYTLLLKEELFHE